MGRKGVDCGCGAREDILDRLAALRQRVEVLETEINQVESQFPEVLRDVRSAEASAVSAAESAGASAEIVESYSDRLGAVEQGVIDVNDYAEAIGDDVSAIDTEIHTTRPYMTTNTEQTITAKKHIPTATINDDSDVAVNKAFVQATDGRNNLLHNIGSETIDGLKNFKSHIEISPSGRTRDATIIKNDYLATNTTIPSQMTDRAVRFTADDNSNVAKIIIRTETNGTRVLRIGLVGTDGIERLFNLMTLMPDGTVIHPWS